MSAIPATQMRLKLDRVGVDWDAVRMRADAAALVAKAVGEDCGSVISDGLHAWFLVRPGAGRELDVPGVTVCLPGSHILVPADRVRRPPGPHWARLAAQRWTPAGLLLRAIEETDS